MSQKLRLLLLRSFNLLTEPIRYAYPPGEKIKAKLTTFILLVLIFLVVAENIAGGNTPIFFPVILVATYVLSRVRHYKIAATIMIFALMVPSFLVVWEADPKTVNDQPIQWLLLPIVLASFLFSIRGLILVVLAIAVSLSLIVFFQPLSSLAILEPGAFLFSVTFLIAVVAYQRDLVEKERESELKRLFASSQREVEERRLIEQTLQLKMEQLEELRRITLGMTSELDVDLLYQLIVVNGLQLLGGSQGALYLFDEEKRAFLLVTALYEGELPEKARVIPWGKGIVGKTWQVNEPVVVANYEAWHGRIPELEELVTQKSFIAVPVKWQEEAHGVLILGADPPNFYTNDDKRLINLLATQAAIALQNAQLNAEIQKNANHLQAQIHERENAETALRDSQEMLRAILDSIPIRVFWKDRNLNYLGCNQPFATDAGFDSPDEVIGKTDYDFPWKPEEAKFFRDTDRRIIQNDKPEFNIIEPQLQADGKQAWLKTNKVPLKKFDGELFGVLGTYEDISEQISAQEQLEQYTKELEFTNRELQKFAYVASHDLQEPLRKIQQFGDRLVVKYGPDLDDRGIDYLNRMQKSANKMQSLIQDLLAYSRVTMGGLEVKPTDLTLIVYEVLEDLEARLEENRVQISFKKLPTIDADPVQMKQLFLNLISNAVKFSAGESEPLIRINAEKVDEGQWQISVADNGIGFDEKYEERVFGVFQRLHPDQVYQGTGVGLALCKQVVERHNGKIWAESKPGEGATFIFTLPETQA